MLPRCFLPCESVDGFGVIALACFGEGLWPFGMIDRVGPELGLQSDAAALAVPYASLAGFLQEVARVELNAGQVRVNSHHSAGLLVGQLGAGIAEDFVVVVVAALQVQRLIILSDIPPDSLGFAEVHGGTGDTSDFAGGNAFVVRYGKDPAGDGENLLHCLFGLILACQIEIAVVGQIEDGILIADTVVDNVQTAPGIQGVSYPNLRLAGEALVTLGRNQLQGDGIRFVGDHIPHTDVVIFRTAVEIVFAFVGNEGIGLAAEAEATALDAVGASAYDGAKEAGVPQIAGAVVIAQNHIVNVTVLVRNVQGYQCRAEVGDLGGDAAAGDGIEEGFSAAWQSTEGCFHDVLLSFGRLCLLMTKPTSLLLYYILRHISNHTF